MYDISVKSFFIEDRIATSQNEIFEIFLWIGLPNVFASMYYLMLKVQTSLLI